MLLLPEAQALRVLTRDGGILFGMRAVRLFAYGSLSVVLALYLAQLGFSARQIGLLLTLILVGDAGVSLGIATVADRLGRRRMLLVSAGLMVFAGLVLALTRNVGVGLWCSAYNEWARHHWRVTGRLWSAMLCWG